MKRLRDLVMGTEQQDSMGATCKEAVVLMPFTEVLQSGGWLRMIVH